MPKNPIMCAMWGVQATFAMPEASEVILPTLEGFHPSPVGEPDFHLNGSGWGGEPDWVGLAEQESIGTDDGGLAVLLSTAIDFDFNSRVRPAEQERIGTDDDDGGDGGGGVIASTALSSLPHLPYCP